MGTLHLRREMRPLPFYDAVTMTRRVQHVAGMRQLVLVVLIAQQPGTQIGVAAGQLTKAHVLIIGVGQQGVAGAEVHGGDSDFAQARHIRPSVLRLRFLPHGLNQGGGQRSVQARAGRRGEIHEVQLVPGEHLAHVGDRLVQGLVRGEAVVHVHCRRVGNHVTGHATRNLHSVQTLTVIQALHGDSFRLVGGERRQRGRQGVNRVLAAPGPARVGSQAVGAHEETHGAVAAALNGAVGRLE